MGALAVEQVAAWEDELRWTDPDDDWDLPGFSRSRFARDRSDVSAGAAVFGAMRAYYSGRGVRDPERLAHRGAVAALLAQDGLPVEAIADRLGVSVDTITRDLQTYGRLRGARRLRRAEARAE